MQCYDCEYYYDISEFCIKYKKSVSKDNFCNEEEA